MLHYYLKIALRNVRKNGFYSFISIIGLAVGLAAFVILISYVNRERHYDQFHADKDQIYRVESYFTKDGQVTDNWASASFGYGASMKKEFPEIQEVTRVNNYDCERVVRYKEKIYREPRVVMADSNFFSFFSYKLIRGKANEVLTQPNSVVLSAATARKFFGEEDPVGKMMDITSLKTKYHCMVTGVYEDFPRESHLQLPMMISYVSASQWENNTWYMHESYLYAKTLSRQAAMRVEQKFPALAEKYKTEAAMKFHQWQVHLVPLESIHLNDLKGYELELKGNRGTINLLTLIAWVVLIISWVNYINLFISKAMERAGEIGVRKMAGAGNPQIFQQFIAEAFLVNTLALQAFFVVVLAMTTLAGLLGIQELMTGLWEDPFTWQCCVVAFAAGTITTGIVPALILRGVDTATVLKNKMAFKSGMGKNVRKALIVFQYTASVTLIIAAWVIWKQIKYMQHKELGINTTQTLVIKAPAKADNYTQRMKSLVLQWKQIAGVRSVTASSAIPGRMVGYGMANRRAGDPDKINRMCEMIRVDEDYLPAYGLQLSGGRNFSKTHPADSISSVVLTENAMHLFGFKNVQEALEGDINLEGYEDRRFRVIGVVKDYHQLSVREAYKPIVFTMYNPWNWIDNHFVSLKLESGNAHSLMPQLAGLFKETFPESSFDSFFLDEFFSRQYQQDIQYGQLITLFSWLAIIIVVLGILAMSSFMLLKRKKEIGIRKVNGATTMHILALLNKDFVRLVLLASLIAMPVAWYVMHGWLQNYANRTSIDWWIFLLVGGGVVLVTITTVTLQSFSTAAKNPVKALRHE